MNNTKIFFYPLLIASLGITVISFTLVGYEKQAKKPAQTTRPNILFIVSEDNGPELGCYGAPVKTPHLDALAKEGTRFANAYVTQAGCSPSRASFLTGLYPHQNGQVGLATWDYSMYDVKTPNLVNSLKTSGYRTGLIGKLHVNPEAAFNFDFQEINGGNFERKGIDRYANAASKFMTESNEPFYLQVNYSDAHRPFIPQVNGRPKVPLLGKDVKVMPNIGVTSDSLKDATPNYYNSIMRLDQYIGDLLAKLKASGKYENTLIVYMGDHGEDIVRGKRTCYDTGQRIPLIISWPGKTGPANVYKGLTSTIDLFPTFMEAAGNPIPKHLPGKSLVNVLRGDEKPLREYLFAEYNVHSNHNPYPQRSVRDGKYKMVYNLCGGTVNPGYDYTIGKLVNKPSFDLALKAAPQYVKDGYKMMKTPPEFELYDLTKDPYEWHNLAAKPEFAPVVKKYRTVILNWMRETNDPFIDKQLARRFFNEVMASKEKNVAIGYHAYMDPKYNFAN